MPRAKRSKSVEDKPEVKPKVKKPSTYRTGWCAQGWCEGTKAKTFRGNPAPTCTYSSSQCACPCHKKIDEIYELAGLPRVIHNESSYKPPPSPYIMPDRMALVRAREERRAAQKDPNTPGAITAAGHVFTPTPTGNRGRGQLEYEVLECLQAWIDPTFEMIEVTPALVAGVMAKTLDSEPSTGAIHAVWVRWREIGFADFQNRPARFLGFKDASTVGHLDKLKHDRKRSVINQNRNIPA